MKFEKFLKSVGAYGRVFERTNGDKWLVCDGVGMKIPTGVLELLGGGKVDHDMGKAVINAVISADTADDILHLSKAVLFDRDGKSGDICRVFETELDIELETHKVGIWNKEYGLLEKKDILTYLEIEDYPDEHGDVKTVKYIVVLDEHGETIGFIAGTYKI